MDELSRGEFLAAIAAVTALTSTGVFVLLWWFWLRRFERRLHRLGEQLASPPSDSSGKKHKLKPATEPENGELVATFKLSTSDHTVSIIEEDGKRFLRVDGKLTEQEREQMLRYLKSEGFLG